MLHVRDIKSSFLLSNVHTFGVFLCLEDWQRFKAGPPPALVKWYGYSTVDEYLEDTYFDDTHNDTTDNSMMDTFSGSTNEDTTDNETTNKKITVGTTGKNLFFYEDTLEKYVPFGKSASKKNHLQKPYSNHSSCAWTSQCSDMG
ncbi:hypothetical protein Tco_0676219 [Tanacetum coccineum]